MQLFAEEEEDGGDEGGPDRAPFPCTGAESKDTTGETPDNARTTAWETCFGPPRDTGGLITTPKRWRAYPKARCGRGAGVFPGPGRSRAPFQPAAGCAQLNKNEK